MHYFLNAGQIISLSLNFLLYKREIILSFLCGCVSIKRANKGKTCGRHVGTGCVCVCMSIPSTPTPAPYFAIFLSSTLLLNVSSSLGAGQKSKLVCKSFCLLVLQSLKLSENLRFAGSRKKVECHLKTEIECLEKTIKELLRSTQRVPQAEGGGPVDPESTGVGIPLHASAWKAGKTPQGVGHCRASGRGWRVKVRRLPDVSSAPHHPRQLRRAI